MAKKKMIQKPTMERYLFATQLASRQCEGGLIRRDSCDWGSEQTRLLAQKVEVLIHMLLVQLDSDGDGDVDAKDLRGLSDELGIP